MYANMYSLHIQTCVFMSSLHMGKQNNWFSPRNFAIVNNVCCSSRYKKLAMRCFLLLITLWGFTPFEVWYYDSGVSEVGITGWPIGSSIPRKRAGIFFFVSYDLYWGKFFSASLLKCEDEHSPICVVDVHNTWR
jgi:hypothetical protein